MIGSMEHLASLKFEATMRRRQAHRLMAKASLDPLETRARLLFDEAQVNYELADEAERVVAEWLAYHERTS